jgi:coenzyme F420-reducing hydrogenase beta subunit
VAPGDLRAIDFRTKLPDRPANSYAVTVSGIRDGHPTTVTKPTSELFGANWGHGFFKYKACEFCDDVVGETADISFGDAWLPEYESDSAGTNVVVVRSRVLNSLLTDAAGKGRLHLECISAGKVQESQSGGFRHRRDGLSYRLFLEDQAGRWRPKKRVEPSDIHLTKKLKKIYKSRYELGQLSLLAFAEAKEKGNFDLFLQIMKPMVTQYNNLYRRSYPFRILGRIKRITFKFIDIIKTNVHN